MTDAATSSAVVRLPAPPTRVSLPGGLRSGSYPDAIVTEPTLPNEIGMHRVAFSVDDIDKALEIAATHGCYPLPTSTDSPTSAAPAKSSC